MPQFLGTGAYDKIMIIQAGSCSDTTCQLLIDVSPVCGPCYREWQCRSVSTVDIYVISDGLTRPSRSSQKALELT